MIGQALQDAINDQINAELYSSYLYLAMAADCEARNLKGFAQWLRVQSREETTHAMKFFDYLIDRGGRVALKAIDQPPTEFPSPRECFRQTLAHEREVTARINQLYQLAQREGDPATQTLLHWFLDEQVEEEASASEALAKLEMIGESGSALVMLDHQFGKRAE
jgi:ferritin